MKIKKIDESEYTKFVESSNQASMYQSISWKREKELENKECELLGLYDNSTLVGVSLVVYVKFLKKFKYAYLSRGFIYDYKNINEFKSSLVEYFKNKNVVFVRIDPLVVLNEYDTKLEKKEFVDNKQVINNLIKNGFIHFGFNMSNEATQFRFVHVIDLEDSYDKQLSLMSKSTRKNINIAIQKGVKIKQVNSDKLDEVMHFFKLTEDRKGFVGLSETFYQNLIKSFDKDICFYLVYIDKEDYINNLNELVSNYNKKLDEVLNKMEHDHVGNKLRKNKEDLLNGINKCKKELEYAKTLDNFTNIGSLVTIKKYSEVVSFASGMDNQYKSFLPKYIMYSHMIKDAINNNYKRVNFLGVKNIFDENDKDHGVYEIKRGFGGKTIEYIGEFDLPINKKIYKLYKFYLKIK